MQKIISVFKAKDLLLTSTNPNQGSPTGANLIGNNFCQFINLQDIQNRERRLNVKMEAAVEDYLRAIVEEKRAGSGLLLVVPASEFDPMAGPVWIRKGWPSWPLNDEIRDCYRRTHRLR